MQQSQQKIIVEIEKKVTKICINFRLFFAKIQRILLKIYLHKQLNERVNMLYFFQFPSARIYTCVMSRNIKYITHYIMRYKIYQVLCRTIQNILCVMTRMFSACVNIKMFIFTQVKMSCMQNLQKKHCLILIF